jgi:hypothetical protein
LVWHLIAVLTLTLSTVKGAAHLVFLGVSQDVDSRSSRAENRRFTQGTYIDCLPVELGFSIAMFEAYLMYLRSVLIDLPFDSISLIRSSIGAKETESNEVNVDLWNEHDAIPRSTPHKHVIVSYNVFEANKLLYFAHFRRLRNDSKHLHLLHVELLD